MPRESAVWSRARGPIAFWFPRWESRGLSVERRGATVARPRVRLGSWLWAVLVQHWLLLTGVGGAPCSRLATTGEAIRRHRMWRAVAVGDQTQLAAESTPLGVIRRVTAKQNQRKKPSPFELLNDPSLLDYFLT